MFSHRLFDSALGEATNVLGGFLRGLPRAEEQQNWQAASFGYSDEPSTNPYVTMNTLPGATGGQSAVSLLTSLPGGEGLGALSGFAALPSENPYLSAFGPASGFAPIGFGGAMALANGVLANREAQTRQKPVSAAADPNDPNVPRITRIRQQQAAQARQTGSQTTSSGAPVDPRLEAGQTEDEQYIRQAAAQRGIDPDMAVRVANTEGGANPRGRGRQNMHGAPAYSHFQLYIGGPGNSGIGDEALAAGIDPRDPNQWQKAIDFALDKALERGWQPFQGAAAAGIGDWDGIRGWRPQDTGFGGGNNSGFGVQADGTVPNPTSGTGDFGMNAATASQQQGSARATRSLSGITPAQYSQGLPRSVADALCGPIAAEAFRRWAGHEPNLAQTLNLARDSGQWSEELGMNYGTSGVVAVLAQAGIPAYAAPMNKSQMIEELNNGRPVIINLGGNPAAGNNGHFLVAEGYNAATDQFDFGESAKALRSSGGNQWWRIEDVTRLNFGSVRDVIYAR